MKGIQHHAFTLSTAIFGLLVQLIFWSPALAATTQANASPEAFRQELYTYLSEIENAVSTYDGIPAVHQRFAPAGLRPLDQLAVAKATLLRLQPEHLSAMQATYAAFPEWRQLPVSLNSLSQRLSTSVVKRASNGVSPKAITPDNCADGINADVSNTDIAGATAAQIAAEAIMEAFPTDGLTILARLIPIAVVAAAQSGVLAAQTLKDIKDDCTALDASAVQGIVNTATTSIANNDNANRDTILSSITSTQNTIVNNDNSNRATIVTAVSNAETSINNTSNSNTAIIATDITNAQTSINNTSNANTTTITTAITNAQTAIINTSNANTTTIVNNDNANKAAIIENANANRDLLLRTQIEQDLAQADNATPVALFLLPASAGGYIELVQTIVTDILTKVALNGGNLGNAQSFLNQANAARSAGQYGGAYQLYRRAYKTAANGLG